MEFSQKYIGAIYALGAFGIWGILPVYFKAVEHINPLELLAQRIAWSFILLLILLFFIRGFGSVKKILANKKAIFTLFMTAALIAANWLTYIIAIHFDMITEASLGYFITPLINIILGIVFLKESSSLLEKIAVCIAAFAVLFEVIQVGKIPYIALILAITFGLYGFIHKKINTAPFNRLFLETSILMPMSLIYIIFLSINGLSTINLTSDITLIVLSGPVTVVPLLLFVSAASRINLITLGFIQYLSPTITFSLALFVYNEPIFAQRVVTFILIWLSITIVAVNNLKALKRKV